MGRVTKVKLHAVTTGPDLFAPFFVAAQTTMPVWQNWWNWHYLATRVLVIAGASVAKLIELTLFGHKHSYCCTDHYASVAELMELTVSGHMCSCCCRDQCGRIGGVDSIWPHVFLLLQGPVWQNWWNWQYLAICILVHLCVCHFPSNFLKSHGLIFTVLETQICHLQGDFEGRLVLRKIIVVYTKFFIWQFLIEPVLYWCLCWCCVICIGAVCQSPVLTGEILCEKLIGQDWQQNWVCFP